MNQNGKILKDRNALKQNHNDIGERIWVGPWNNVTKNATAFQYNCVVLYKYQAYETLVKWSKDPIKIFEQIIKHC